LEQDSILPESGTSGGFRPITTSSRLHCNTDRILILPDEGADPPPPTGTGADFFDEQWGLNNTGQLLNDPTLGTQTLTGTPDADIDAPDGMINGADLLIGQRIVLGLITAGILELSHGDLYPPGNPDGVINIQDMLLLQQIVTTP
ncbi:MAG: hypothetical protein WBN81_16855, partial [Gammaproteobacteria bacterium]